MRIDMDRLENLSCSARTFDNYLLTGEHLESQEVASGAG